MKSEKKKVKNGKVWKFHFSLFTFYFSFFISYFSTASAQSSEPALRINPSAHAGIINRIATDSKGEYLLTASSDKTARLWNVSTGNCLKIFRPSIGAGREGELSACALSPDGAVAVVAGVAGTVWGSVETDTAGFVDFQNRSKIVRYSIYFFSTTSGKMLMNFDTVGAEVLDMQFSPNGTKLVAALSDARGLLVFDAANIMDYRKLIGFSAPVRRIAFSMLGEMAVIADDGMIALYDANFELKKSKLLRGKLSDLAFSPDDKELVVAFADNTPLTLLDAGTLDVKPNSILLSADKTSLFSHVAISPAGVLYAGGYYNSAGSYQIRVWKPDGETVDIKAARRAINNMISLPDGAIVYTSVGPETGRILPDSKSPLAWTLIPQSIYTFTPETTDCLQLNANGSEVGFVKSGTGVLFFSVGERKLYEGESSYKMPTDYNAKYGIRISRWHNSQLPYLNSIAKSVFEKDEVGVCVDVAENGKVILMGTDKHVYALDRHGGLLWKRTVQDGATAVKVSGNGNIAAATLGDGTLAWFKIADGEHLMTLFADPHSRKWVLWTPEGFYDCTAGADELAGWHINRGTHSAADFYPLSRFRKTFYRPDIIDAAVTNILTAKELSTQVSDDVKRIAQNLPPTACIVSMRADDSGKTSAIKLSVDVQTLDNTLPTSLRILANGRPLLELTDVKTGINNVEIELPFGDCTISAIAADKHGAGTPASLVFKGRQHNKTVANMHILAIGVSEYAGELALRYPAKDAADFAAAMKHAGASGGSVSTQLLVNAQATKSAVIDGLNRLKAETAKNDVALIFVSGHCMNTAAGNYFFLPAQSSIGSVKSSGINFGDIRNIVSQISGTVIMFLDVSHSGYLTEIKSEAIFDVNGVVNELASPETGAIVFVSSTGRGFSAENAKHGNGAFVKAIIEGIHGAAFAAGSAQLTATQLNSYIARRVSELTGGTMQPALVIPSNVPDVVTGK